MLKPIKGFRGAYFASSEGAIWAPPKTNYLRSGRWTEGRFLKPYVMKNGYEQVTLYKGRKPHKFLVHRLVALSFIENPERLPQINHINGDKRDNRPQNLEWVTCKQNIAHGWSNGMYDRVGKNPARGENSGKSKLTEQQVREIRSRNAAGETYSELGRDFGMTKENISCICRGLTWRHIL